MHEPIASLRKGVEPDPDLELERLRWAVAAANIPTLVMVLYQLTGDQRWLEPPYRPTKTKGLADHDSGGIDEPGQKEIREAAVAAIAGWHRGAPAAVPHPDLDLLLDLLSTCVGEPVPGDYAEMMMVEMGFEPARQRRHFAPAELPPAFRVAIVGAGISGLLARLLLREAGIPSVVFEKSDSIGGTWHDNRYPGAGVDTPSYLYAYSFFPRNWSRYFARQGEIYDYIREMASQFGLMEGIQFRTEVLGARYDADRQRWTLRVRNADGSVEDVVANALITATGLLNIPQIPALTGMSEFSGPMFHSARWPKQVDLRGKRVAVVGSGASSMQIVPAIADSVSELAIFQRSPQWIAPVEQVFQAVVSEVHWLMANVPYYREWVRFRHAWTYNDKSHDALQIDPTWSYPERAVSKKNDQQREYFTKFILAELKDRPDLHEKCIPTYPPFEKRMLLDHGWYKTLTRPNVELITEAVSGFTSDAVVTASGREWPADIVVMCTGFHPQAPLYPMEIRGRSGVSIREAWGMDDPRAYLGTTAPDFPNLFTIRGPNTTPGGGSSVFIIECQVNYAVDLIESMLAQDVGAVEVRRDVHDAYNRRLDDAHSHMIWTHPGATTYYRNAKGRVVVNMPWRVVDYWKLTRRPDLNDFILEPRAGREPSAQNAHESTARQR